MSNKGETNDSIRDLKCPECRCPLKPRRARVVDKCELVCGGCGLVLDVCDMDTLARLKNHAP